MVVVQGQERQMALGIERVSTYVLDLRLLYIVERGAANGVVMRGCAAALCNGSDLRAVLCSRPPVHIGRRTRQ